MSQRTHIGWNLPHCKLPPNMSPATATASKKPGDHFQSDLFLAWRIATEIDNLVKALILVAAIETCAVRPLRRYANSRARCH
eukprot:7519866-Pyramimonas_sp.AAC.1